LVSIKSVWKPGSIDLVELDRLVRCGDDGDPRALLSAPLAMHGCRILDPVRLPNVGEAMGASEEAEYESGTPAEAPLTPFGRHLQGVGVAAIMMFSVCASWLEAWNLGILGAGTAPSGPPGRLEAHGVGECAPF
jgi:hypothetical protein